jgi:hypothetical protein
MAFHERPREKLRPGSVARVSLPRLRGVRGMARGVMLASTGVGVVAAGQVVAHVVVGC